MVDGQELPYLKLRLVAGPHGIEVRHSEVGGILPTTIGIGIAVLICSGLGLAMILDNAYIRGLGWLLIGSLLFTVGALLWRLSHRPVLFTVYAPERTLRYSTFWGYRTISFTEVQIARVEGPILRSHYFGPYHRREWLISLRMVTNTGKRRWLFTSYHHVMAQKDVKHGLTELRTLASMVNKVLEQSR